MYSTCGSSDCLSMTVLSVMSLQAFSWDESPLNILCKTQTWLSWECFYSDTCTTCPVSGSHNLLLLGTAMGTQNSMQWVCLSGRRNQRKGSQEITCCLTSAAQRYRKHKLVISMAQFVTCCLGAKRGLLLLLFLPQQFLGHWGKRLWDLACQLLYRNIQ